MLFSPTICCRDLSMLAFFIYLIFNHCTMWLFYGLFTHFSPHSTFHCYKQWCCEHPSYTFLCACDFISLRQKSDSKNAGYQGMNKACWILSMDFPWPLPVISFGPRVPHLNHQLPAPNSPLPRGPSGSSNLYMKRLSLPTAPPAGVQATFSQLPKGGNCSGFSPLSPASNKRSDLMECISVISSDSHFSSDYFWPRLFKKSPNSLLVPLGNTPYVS